ncbi:MAG TPA: hypothetical protein H9875_01260 [Candidatus Levilactobacillus faecigallinarum]|uniref:Uncharacterized protein n=1 Tax=Candidatus Levilactobacillus faecigallinarum TaxID=2838638 RepID=A0A9D1U426_9LACO|nr:hypothetical protein [Candidatus Levilactobacillus faecigallinarum]
MQTAYIVLSGISDLALLVFIFLWGFDFARKDRPKNARKHHYAWYTLASLAATFVFMFLSGAGK